MKIDDLVQIDDLKRLGFQESRLDVDVKASIVHLTPETRETYVQIADRQVEAVRARYENPVRIVMRYGLGFFVFFIAFMGGMVVLAKVLELDRALTLAVLVLGAVVVVPALGIIFTKYIGKILSDVVAGIGGAK